MPTASEDEQAHTRPQRGRPQRPRLFVASERAGARPLQGLTLLLPSDPSRQARNAASGGSAELTGLAVSGVGLDDPARRGAEGGHQAVDALRFDYQ